MLYDDYDGDTSDNSTSTLRARDLNQGFLLVTLQMSYYLCNLISYFLYLLSHTSSICSLVLIPYALFALSTVPITLHQSVAFGCRDYKLGGRPAGTTRCLTDGCMHPGAFIVQHQ